MLTQKLKIFKDTASLNVALIIRLGLVDAANFNHYAFSESCNIWIMAGSHDSAEP